MTCPICNNSGWKTVENENNGHKTAGVVRCDCRMKSRSDQLLAAARIPSRYQHCDIDSFDTDFPGAHRSLSAARISAAKFIEQYPVERDGLILVGPSGLGKTHLAVGIIQGLILTKGIHCLFYDYRELLKQIQNSYNPSVDTTEMDILQPVFETEILALDDLGAVKPTEWVWDTVSHILNYRYNNKRTTIITTNFPDKPALGTGETNTARRAARDETLGDRIGERMRSRLHEMCRIIEMEGNDFRYRVGSATKRYQGQH